MANDPIKPPPSTPPTVASATTKTPEQLKADELKAKAESDKVEKEHQEQIRKEREEFLRKSQEETNAFLHFPEVRKLTRVEYLTKVRDILNLHSSDSNSASKAYAEIESITPS